MTRTRRREALTGTTGRRPAGTTVCAAATVALGVSFSLCEGGSARTRRAAVTQALGMEYLYEKNMRVWNMNCGGMRASTVGCRVLDRCGDSLGVESSFKDICILARF